MLWAQVLMKLTLSPLWDDQGIPLAIMGIMVVFAALTLVVISISLLSRILARVHKPVVAATSAAANDELSAETLVVIAAAASEALGAPHRIVHIRGLTPLEMGWSLEGRMQQHQSHQPQHRDRS